MNNERGMITLMTVFSGIAALMCLLVGLQLLSLESQIGQASVPGSHGSGNQFSQWQTEVHTGAVMSFGAGVLVFLFGLRNHSTSRNTRRKRLPVCDLDPSTIDLESLSIRVFEVDDEDRSIEITSGNDAPPEPRTEQPRIHWHPLEDHDEDPQPGQTPDGDPAESIVQSIQDAIPSGNGRAHPPLADEPVRRSFLSRLFGTRSRP